MNDDEYRRGLQRMIDEEAARVRRRFVLRMAGWCVLLAAFGVVAWVAVTS